MLIVYTCLIRHFGVYGSLGGVCIDLVEIVGFSLDLAFGVGIDGHGYGASANSFSFSFFLCIIKINSSAIMAINS